MARHAAGAGSSTGGADGAPRAGGGGRARQRHDAGYTGVQARAPQPSSAAKTASMRFPTVARDDGAPKRSGGGAKIAAIAVYVVLLLAASGVGAYGAESGSRSVRHSSNTNTNDTKRVLRAEDERAVSRRGSQAPDEQDSRRKARKKQRADDAKLAAEEDARRKARKTSSADEAKRRAEEEARRRAEQEEARRKAEEERRRAEEGERRADDPRKAEEEQRRREEARRAEEEARRRDEEAQRRRAEEDQRRREQEDARRKAEEEQRRREQEEARRRDEENRARGVSCDFSVASALLDRSGLLFRAAQSSPTLSTARDGAAEHLSNPAPAARHDQHSFDLVAGRRHDVPSVPNGHRKRPDHDRNGHCRYRNNSGRSSRRRLRGQPRPVGR